MKNSLRNKPCLCGSNKKMKKCCGDNTQTTYENSELGKETFKKWGGEISNELGMMNTYEIIEEMNPYFFPKTERIGLVSDEVLVSLDRRWYEDVQRVCWNLETIRIKSDKRGHGIGEKVMSVILKISKKYKCPLTLTPQEIDLSKNTKTTSVNFLELVKTNEDVKKHFSKSEDEFLEHVISHHLDVIKINDSLKDDNEREELHQLNTLRLNRWYKRMGFTEYFTQSITGWEFLVKV